MSKWLVMLITGLTLGLGWAIRGHFGHWWGASWAGGMGVIALLLAIGRDDWIKRMPVLALLGAIGWGFGGVMSYGVVIGYCRSAEFFNSTYGYAMLFIIGGLYGFIGGGLFGLGLSTDEKKKVDWMRLLLEMFVIGSLAYWFFIIEMEWLMTPPRDESWAICLGSASALAWYQYRSGKINSLRVAIYSGLGGGIGFAFGNFLQTIGSVSGLSYNWWNVMEFTLGLFGGIGMTYGVLTSGWSEKVKPNNRANWITIAILIFVIPAINIFQSFDSEKITQLAERVKVSDAVGFVGSIQIMVWVLVMFFTLVVFYAWKKITAENEIKKNGIILLSSYSILYTVFGVIRTGWAYSESFLANSVTTYLIILPFVITLLFLNKEKSYQISNAVTNLESMKFWGKVFVGLILFFFIIAIISTGSHDGLSGAHNRF
jgi:hypothetical protein